VRRDIMCRNMAPTMPGTPATVSKKMKRFNHASRESACPAVYPVSLSNDHRAICTKPYAT